jgi:hypothetical protein
MYVASVCFKYFSYFRRMLQVFYLDITYVAVAIHICCKRMFQMFHFVLEVFCSKCFNNKAASASAQQHASSRRRHAVACEVLRREQKRGGSSRRTTCEVVCSTLAAKSSRLIASARVLQFEQPSQVCGTSQPVGSRRISESHKRSTVSFTTSLFSY